MNITIAKLKSIIANLPDNMPVIIPVTDERNCNLILGFRFARTAGILSCEYENPKEVFCINTSDDQDIAEQVYFSGKDAIVNQILFGKSEYEKENE